MNFMDLCHLNERCQNFQLQVFHIPDTVRAPLNDPDFVVESLHESEGHFMIRMTITDDVFPMAFDQPDKLYENEWQSFLTKKDRSLKLKSPFHESKAGHRKIAVKVVDIFGNDTMKVIEVSL